MSDATTPANPTGQIATVAAVLSPEPPIVPASGTKRVPDDSEVVQDAQQYDWRRDALTLVCFTTDDESHQALKRFIAYIERLEAERDALHDALRWCSGSADFAPGGQAREGWQRQVAPLLDNAERVIRGE